MNFSYVRSYYNVPAEFGRVVIAYGKRGVIVEDRGHHIGILLDESKAGDVCPYHPVDGIQYLDIIEKPRKPKKSRQRYLDYKDDLEWFDGTFIEYCQWCSRGKPTKVEDPYPLCGW
jgi:hypothetical protein